MRSEHSWSLLDPKPVLLYLEQHDDYIVYWGGIVMPHSMALAISMEMIGIHPTPEMRNSMEDNYRRLYYAGAFETRKWDDQVASSPLYSYLKRVMVNSGILEILKDREPKEILGWFNYNRARVENTAIDKDH